MSFLERLKSTKINSALVVAAIILFMAAWAVLIIGRDAQAEEAVGNPRDVNLYIFWGDGCPHCAHAKEALEPYVSSHNFVKYHQYEVYYNAENQAIMRQVGTLLGINASGVPLIVVGDTHYLGFSEQIGLQIEARLSYCSVNECSDKVAGVVGLGLAREKSVSEADDNDGSEDQLESGGSYASEAISLPVLGDVSVASISLPLLTVAIALVDGFNPCAMWALLLIISLLVGMQNRRRMWAFGGVFIATSAIVYFMFMAAWLNLFVLIGQVVWLRAFIGLSAVAIGIYYLYDWHQKRSGCSVTDGSSKKAVSRRLRGLVERKNLWFALGGIVLLAASVNIVELACSAGLPVLYTGILSSVGLEAWQYYAYMLLYVFFFMLDDLIVFAVAMLTFRVVGIESKYSRAVRLVGGVILCLLGVLLVLAPQFVMLG